MKSNASATIITNPSFPAPLRRYQLAGISFLARRNTALLADEMGLGKTVQTAVALEILLKRKGCNRALIIAPASLLRNWIKELETWTPALVTRILRGSAQDRTALYTLPIQVLVGSYEQIRVDAIKMRSLLRFDIVILDEAQRIKNANSETALACKLISRTHSWALTGTPIENHPQDLISIFQFLKPGLLSFGMTRDYLHARIQPYFLRRKKAAVLKELPPIIVQDLPLELNGQQRSAYLEAWHSRNTLVDEDSGHRGDIWLLALITRLKQLCNYDPMSGESVKFESLKLILESLSGHDDKVLVFSQFVETLKFISENLGYFPHDLFHGEMSDANKFEVLSRFEMSSGPRALLISLKAGGVGLNLQAASKVVLFDRWWNPATEEQAIHRAHRFGRKKHLQVIRFLIINSIEERIRDVLITKNKFFEEFVEKAPSASAPIFTMAELKRILDLPLDKGNVH